jgi:hypothetical protein
MDFRSLIIRRRKAKQSKKHKKQKAQKAQKTKNKIETKQKHKN